MAGGSLPLSVPHWPQRRSEEHLKFCRGASLTGFLFCRLAKAHAWSATVLVDELDAPKRTAPVRRLLSNSVRREDQAAARAYGAASPSSNRLPGFLWSLVARLSQTD